MKRRLEPGLLGALSFPEPEVLLTLSDEVWFSRVVDRMVPVLGIGASLLKVAGLVSGFDWSCRRLTGPVEPGSGLVAVAVAVLVPELLLGLVGPEPPVMAPASQLAVFSIPVCPWDLQSVSHFFPIARKSPRISFLQM